MSRASTLMILGVLVILTPFSGFPSSMRSFFDVLLGIVIFATGLILRTRQTRSTLSETNSSSQPAPLSPDMKNTISSI